MRCEAGAACTARVRCASARTKDEAAHTAHARRRHALEYPHERRQLRFAQAHREVRVVDGQAGGGEGAFKEHLALVLNNHRDATVHHRVEHQCYVARVKVASNKSQKSNTER